MELYRKPDQFYFDQYDRRTIKRLTELEEQEKDKIWNGPIYYPNSDRLMVSASYNCFTRFYNMAVRLARNREDSIRSAMAADEKKDLLIKQNSIPKNVRCNTCGEIAKFESYLFKEEDTVLLFIFSCPKKHPPRKAIYPSGEEYSFPKRKCGQCGHSNISTSTETKDKLLIFTDTCNHCGNVSIMELESGPEEPEQPISEQDRKKYCIDFIGRRTFEEDLIAINELAEIINISEQDKKKKEECDYDKIETLTLPQLENRLTNMSERIGFTKFQFGKTETGKHVIAEFSVQDPTNRNNHDSIKSFSKGIKKELHLTNWRLMATGITYRLGILGGQLKAYETEDDLIKLAKQLKTTSKHKA